MNTPAPNPAYEQIARFVQTRLQTMAEQNPSEWRDPVYRWEHTLRVAHYGRVIAEAEGADIGQVTVACLLHDVAHFDPLEDHRDHGRRGAQLSRPLLEELGYSPAAVDNICYAITVHVDGKADFDHPYTLEARCVTDADNIDRFGAYRILHFCCPEMGNFPQMAEKLTQRLTRLQEYRSRAMMLETVTGDRIFKQQLDRQIAFFKALLDEHNITTLPG